MKKINTIFLLLLTFSAFSQIEKIRVTFGNNPSTDITVAWCQNITENPILYYDTQDYGTQYNLYSNKMVCKLQPDFVVFNGDFTSSSTNEEWQQWLNDWQLTINTDGHIIPIVPTNGNHENSQDLFYLFDFETDKYFYSLNTCNNLLNLIILDTEYEIAGEQTDTLINILENSENYYLQNYL